MKDLRFERLFLFILLFGISGFLINKLLFLIIIPILFIALGIATEDKFNRNMIYGVLINEKKKR